MQVGSPLDHETGPSYTVTVKATDPSGDSDTIEVTINVTNADEDGTVTLSWTRPQVGTAITATLTDPDGSISGKSWQWQKSTNRSNWSNATGTGATSATYTPVANDGYLRATASYTDGEGSTKTAHARTATTVRQVPAPNNAPVFYAGQEGQYDCGDTKPKTFCANIRTSHPVGKSIYYPVKATDSRDEVRYSLEGSGSEHFYIEPIRGGLFTKTLPRELPASSYTITIKASDQSGESDTITVTITRLGSDRDPVIVGPSRITYPENGTWPVARYGASNEVGGTIGWFVSVEPGGGDGDFFRINDEGMLLFELPPDYESPWDENGDNSYSFSLTAYETNPPSGRPRMSFFSVTVSVVNVDEALEILGPSVIDYPENSQDAVHTYTVLGADGAVTWSPPSGTDGDNFSMNDGVLAFLSHPDYETPLDLDGGGRDKDQPDNGYLVAITVEDGTNIKTEHVKVRVTNVNEKPTFDDDDLETTLTVEPDAETPDHVGEPITATDPDENDYPSYSLPDDATLPFTISEYTGQLSVDGAIDSTKANYTVVVLATDRADADGNLDTSEDDRITVTINVGGGSSNNVPEFPATETGARSIAENTATVESVGAPVTADDDDTDDTLSYTLGGTDAGFFTIVSDSGQIQTKTGQTYDFETKPSYLVTVTANDGNGGTADKPVTITLNNLEEAGTVTLSTDQPTARAAITATLTDPDNGITGTTWQWSKSDSQNGTYDNISSATSATYIPADGDVGKFLKATASYDDDSYDDDEGSSRSAEASTTSAVQSGTNRAPDFGDLTATRDVAENTAANGNVGAVVGATDLDSDDLAYSLTSTDASSFTVDNTGQIKVGATTMLDYESAKNTYTVVVQVTDSKDAAGNTETNPTIDDTIAVTINVTDVEETGTVTLSNYQPPARVEITATLTDPDGGVTNTTWQWARTLDPANNPWQDITGATSSSYTPPDTDLTYYLRATASYTDRKGSGKNAEAETTQAVGAGANRSPDFSATTAIRSFLENTVANTNIGDAVTATDPDTGNTPAYSLDITGETLFDIDSTSGQIKTKSGVTYNHEITPSYLVTVTANDGNGGTDTIDVTINVTDVNEKPTFDEPDPAARNVPENTSAGQDIGTAVSATDPEVGDTLTYTLGGTDVASFDIVSTSGQLQTKSALNKEADDTYSVTVAVRDRSKNEAGSADTADDATITVNITVTDANDAPQFSADSITRSVPENTGAGENIGGPVTATDGDNDTLTYSLDTADATLFDIDRNSGQIKTKTGVTYDHEATPKYLITVTADDSKGGTDTIDVTVNVTDVDEPPLKPGTPAVSRTSNNVVSVTWTAPDNTGRPPILHYIYQYKKDTEPDWSGATFYTSGSTASVAIGTMDAGTSYDVQVRAKNDEGPGPWSDTGTGSTNSPPDFSSATPAREVAENTVVVTSVGSPVTATDANSDDPEPTRLEGADANSFHIVSASGQIQTKLGTTYDHEAKPSYTVTVKADDSNGGTDTIEVTITVTDVNEAPAFDGPTTAREVPENTGADTDFGSPVEAEDPDAGDDA